MPRTSRPQTLDRKPTHKRRKCHTHGYRSRRWGFGDARTGHRNRTAFSFRCVALCRRIVYCPSGRCAGHYKWQLSQSGFCCAVAGKYVRGCCTAPRRSFFRHVEVNTFSCVQYLLNQVGNANCVFRGLTKRWQSKPGNRQSTTTLDTEVTVARLYGIAKTMSHLASLFTLLHMEFTGRIVARPCGRVYATRWVLWQFELRRDLGHTAWLVCQLRRLAQETQDL